MWICAGAARIAILLVAYRIGDRHPRAAGRNQELAVALAVGAAAHVKHTAAFGRSADPGCRRSVAEQQARRAVLRMNELRIGVRSHHQHILCRVRRDQRLRELDGIDEGGAGMRQVERGNSVAEAEAAVQHAGVRRQDVVRRLRAEDQRVDTLRQIGVRDEKFAAGHFAEIECGLALGCDVTTHHTGVTQQQRPRAVVGVRSHRLVGKRLLGQRDGDPIDGGAGE